jgi:uncharacterized protein
MSLLMSMLPFYLFGNLHCAGMCGPLVLMIGRHRFRYCYFLGRLLSFSLAGLFAGAMGSVLSVFLNQYHLAALACFLFGAVILWIGMSHLTGMRFFHLHFLNKFLVKTNQSLSLLMLRDQPWPTFLFGFFTVALPCGQTVVVFSACALYGDPFVGWVNGLCFALLTSPALLAAMHTHVLFQAAKRHYNLIMGICSVIIGLLAFARGLAEMEIIPHLAIQSGVFSHYHLVIY